MNKICKTSEKDKFYFSPGKAAFCPGRVVHEERAVKSKSSLPTFNLIRGIYISFMRKVNVCKNLLGFVFCIVMYRI